MISDSEMKMLRIEYAKACAKHPDWPTDILHGIVNVAEEAGEAVRAANQHVHEGLCIEKLKTELRHTIVTCARMLKRLED